MIERAFEKFKETSYEQEQKGISKYGKPLDPLDNYDWLQMAIEEQVDGFQYLYAEVEKRKFIARKLRSLLNRIEMPSDIIEELAYWIEELEGEE